MANSLKDLDGRRHFDYIVIGCGGIGSGAVYWLSKKAGNNVLGLEQFKLAHENGGSQDVSRIIRLAYHDDRYTKLSSHSYKAWETVEQDSGLQLVYKTGGLNLSDSEETHSLLSSYGEALKRNGIPFENWDYKQLMRHYPQFTVGPEFKAIFQKDSGIVDAALGNSVHIQLAQSRGAKVLDRCPVKRVTRGQSGLLEVNTPLGTFTCKKVVVTAGGWINDVLSSIGCHVPVYVTQENVTYFASPHIKEFTKERFPICIYHTPQSDVYSLPIHVLSGTKIGVDAGGNVVTADTRTFVPDPVRLKRLQDIMAKMCPKFLGPEMLTKTCLYTMTPDRHFLIDRCTHAGYDDVIVCCGAGHAYKFASVLGKILSEMAVDGHTQHDISYFTWNREALTNPDFKPLFYMGSAPKSKM